jgi:hypothetical protein
MRGVFQKKLKRRQNLSQSISNEMAMCNGHSNGHSNALSNWKAGTHNHLFSRMCNRFYTEVRKKAVRQQRISEKKGTNETSTLTQVKMDDEIWKYDIISTRFKMIFEKIESKCGTLNKYQCFKSKRSNRYEFRLNEFNDIFCYFDGLIRKSMIPRHSDNVYAKNVICDVTDDDEFEKFMSVISLDNSVEKGYYLFSSYDEKMYDEKKWSKLYNKEEFNTKWNIKNKADYNEEHDDIWTHEQNMTLEQCFRSQIQKLLKKKKQKKKKDKKEEKEEEKKEEKMTFIKKKKKKKE